MMRRYALTALALAATAAAPTATAHAGCHHEGRRARAACAATAPAVMSPAAMAPAPAPAAYYMPMPMARPYHAAPAVTPAPRATSATGDPHGFLGMLNAARAARGLPPLAYDPGLAATAAHNNAWQCARGLGHHAMAGAGQCAAMSRDAATALAQWAASPGHAAILFDPAARTCGFAVGGGYATANVGG